MKEAFEQNTHDDPITTSKVTIDLILQTELPWDVLGLYTFYLQTAKWQHTAHIKSVTGYTAKGLKGTEARVRKAKKILLELGLIENCQRRNEKNTIVGHYIKVNYIWVKPTLTDFHSVGNHDTNTKLQTNSLNTKLQTNSFSNILLREKRQRKVKAPINDNDIDLLEKIKQLEQENKKLKEQTQPKQLEIFPEEKQELITPKHFDTFWELYPRKANKGTALSAFLKLCNQKNKQSIRPTLKVLTNAVKQQRKSELWAQMPEYIPYAASWLNANGWMNDPTEMKVFKKAPVNNEHSFRFVGKEIKYKEPIKM